MLASIRACPICHADCGLFADGHVAVWVCVNMHYFENVKGRIGAKLPQGAVENPVM